MANISGEVLGLCSRLGDTDMLVIVVVAVAGRSRETVDIAAFDVDGKFPVSSILRMRDFNSSSSSQTVDGAVVDTVDSVPLSCGFLGCTSSPWMVSRLS